MSSKKALHVLVITWEYAPLMAGGLGPLIQAAVTELRNQNVTTTVAIPHTLTDSGIDDNEIISLSKEVNRYLKTDCELPEYPYNGFNQFLTDKNHKKSSWPDLYSKQASKKNVKNIYPNNMPKMTRAFALAVRDYLTNNEGKFDLIIGPDWHVIALFHLLKYHQISTPFFFYINATQFDRSIKLKGVTSQTINKMEVDTYHKADRIIAISDTSKTILVTHHNVPEQKVITVYDDHDFSPGTKPIELLTSKYGKNVLFLGRLTAQKGLSFLLDTASRVVEIDHEITFILTGQGTALENIIEQICDYGLEKNVFLTGWVNGEDKKSLYKTANLFVMPSPSEPFGLTALEAIHSDVPVISSKTCGFLSVVPSTPTFDYHDTYDFAQKIVYYLQHKDAADELLRQQKEDLAKHSWAKEVAKIKEAALEISWKN